MKLNYKQTFLVGLAFFSMTIMSSLHEGLTPKVLYSFGVGETWIGTIMALDNILAVFMMPLFGLLSDRTNSKYGRRTPYFVFGTIGACVFMVLIPIADNVRNLPMLITVLFIFLVSLATYRSPGVSIMSDVTPKPLRSKANGIINLMGALATMVGIFLVNIFYHERILSWEINEFGDKVPVFGSNGMPLLNSNANNLPLYFAVALIALIAMILFVLTIKEKKLVEERVHIEAKYGLLEEDDPGTSSKKVKHHLPKEEKKSLILILVAIFLWFFGYNAIITFFSNYASIVLGVEDGGFAKYMLYANIFGVLSFLPAGILATKIGRKRAIIIGIFVLGFSFAAASFFREPTPMINVLFSLAGCGWALINVNSLPMVVEFARSDNIGQYTGYYYFFSMFAQIITPVFCGALIEFCDIGYRVLFPYGTIFVAAAVIPMVFVKHGDSKPIDKIDILESFDVD